MVSIAILTLIVFFVNQVVNSATKTTVGSGKRIDSDNQTRLIFAKMEADFDAIYNRADVNFYFQGLPRQSNQGGNDEFYFYSQSPGHFANNAGPGAPDINTASLVGYRVNDGVSKGTSAQLERLGRGLVWTATSTQNGTGSDSPSMLFLPPGGVNDGDTRLIKYAFPNAISDPYNNSSNPNPNALATGVVPEWDVIGDQVVRMEFCFLLTNGAFSQTPMIQVSGSTTIQSGHPTAYDDSSVTPPYAAGWRWYDTSAQVGYLCTNATPKAAVWTYLGLKDVKAVVVTLALLDTQSRASTNMTDIQKIISTHCFPDFSTAPLASSTAPLAGTWTQSANNPQTLVNNTGLSQVAASAFRIYERFFYLN